MKNKLIYIYLLFFTCVSYGQHTYLLEYKATFSTSSIQPAWEVRMYYIEDNVKNSIYNATSYGNYVTVDVFHIFNTAKEIDKLQTSAYSVAGTLTSCMGPYVESSLQSFNECSSNSSFISQVVNSNNCITGSVTKFNLIKIEDFKAINSYSATNNELKACEPKNVLISTNCNYALEYKIPSNTNWEELLPYGNNPASVNISKSDFTGLNVAENVQLRVRYTSIKGETNVNAYSDILSYSVIGCSPELDTVTTNKTTCNYSIDGGFTLNFKRDLNANETLVVTLYDGDNQAILINQEFTSSLVNTGSGIYGYTWVKLLDAGNYKVKFQTHNKNEGIDKNDASWDSLEFSNSFAIVKPEKVKFSIINTSDETCFEKSNGYINIKAEGEGERTFLYQLTKEQVVQFYNGANWVDYSGTKENDETWFPFISKNNTKIGDLAKGNYRVKVKDSKGCFAR